MDDKSQQLFIVLELLKTATNYLEDMRHGLEDGNGLSYVMAVEDVRKAIKRLTELSQ